MAEIIQFPKAPETTDGDGEGPTEIVVRVVFEWPDEPEEPEDAPDPEPPPKAKGGWIWFCLGALLGLSW